MKFLELINDEPWEEVEKSFTHYYGQYFQEFKKRIRKKKLSRFKKTYEQLRNLDPKYSEWRIIVCKVRSDGEVNAVVSGLDGTLYKDSKDYNPDTHSEYANEELPHGLSFTDWSEWLGMDIETVSFEVFSKSEVAAHCLWELTFNDCNGS